MHALLMREDLKDVICWMHHGRAFKIVNPRDFELRVIPTYFEHSKISSFVRQAQGWGFRSECFHSPALLALNELR
ncbi:hypothetical protein ACHAXS_006529 [Conticribra weissflogii]